VDQNALLSRAFVLADESRSDGDHPFGALLAVDGEIVAEAHNRVNTKRDLTAHAETRLVRVLEQTDQLGDLPLGTVYASCEPCPMCVGAMFWAGARRVVFGLSHARLSELAAPPGADPRGFTISAAEIGGRAMPPLTFSGPHREDEAAQAHLGFWVNRLT
jgi:tRNA(Arg) A34 adenosine deaminase TadA